ncbi:putative ribonuclease H protein, partial [Sesbania bispinosa]
MNNKASTWLVGVRFVFRDLASNKPDSLTFPSWGTDWTGLGKFCHKIPYVHISETNLHVKDLWNNGGWALSSLATPLTEHITE